MIIDYCEFVRSSVVNILDYAFKYVLTDSKWKRAYICQISCQYQALVTSSSRLTCISQFDYLDGIKHLDLFSALISDVELICAWWYSQQQLLLNSWFT